MTAARGIYAPRAGECHGCGASIVKKRPNAKWCGDACRMRRARARPDQVRCGVCGVRRSPEAFPAGRRGACRACRSALAKVRRIERARELIVCIACKVARRPDDFSARSRRCKLCVRALARLRRAGRAPEAVPG
jgi:hypothetical protein